MLRRFRKLKKNLEKTLQENPSKRIFFMDEARFGTHSKLGHGWFPKGTRSRVSVKLEFKNFYVYSSIEPASGEAFSLLISSVNTQAMSAFLQEFAKAYPDEDITLVMDGAGWHKAKDLLIPANVKIVFLSPYCPELNPVERFWLHIKKELLRNKIYDSIDHLKDATCSLLKDISPLTIFSICHSY